MTMEFSWSDEEVRFRTRLQEWVATLPEEWADTIPGDEATSEFTRGFNQSLSREGLLTPHWPARYGGRDASGWQFIILGEELWTAGEPRGSQYMNVNWIGPAIMESGTPEQKDEHLRRISAGDVFWCQGFSELGAGTDLGGLETTAVRDGDEYVVNGHKIWTSYAQGAEYCFLLARTGTPESRTRGISIFLVPTDLPGFRAEPIDSVLDIHEFNRLTFTDMRVPASMMLGEVNEGWKAIRLALSYERIGGPRYARALRIARELRQVAASNGWLERDGIRTRLARAEAACEAARILVYRAINERIAKRDEGLVVALARVAIVRSERAVAEASLELFEDASLEHPSTGNNQFKTTMVAGLGGGSVEVQLNAVAGYLLGKER